jgi:hypothetical protein
MLAHTDECPRGNDRDRVAGGWNDEEEGAGGHNPTLHVQSAEIAEIHFLRYQQRGQAPLCHAALNTLGPLLVFSRGKCRQFRPDHGVAPRSCLPAI